MECQQAWRSHRIPTHQLCRLPRDFDPNSAWPPGSCQQGIWHRRMCGPEPCLAGLATELGVAGLEG
eukprot:4402354-Amphidinium_carterae.1